MYFFLFSLVKIKIIVSLCFHHELESFGYFSLKRLPKHSLRRNENWFVFFAIFIHKMNRAQFGANIKNLQLYKAINQGHFHGVNQSAFAYSQWTVCRNSQPTRNRPEQNQWLLSWHIIYLQQCYSHIYVNSATSASLIINVHVWDMRYRCCFDAVVIVLLRDCCK